MHAREFLKQRVYSQSEIDGWLSGKLFPFCKYDSEIGYLHRDRRCREGIAGSLCTYTYDRNTGARSLVNHPNSYCRINTYGDSYTNCEQVNNGETWQEILAARIGEPIRNFGTGAHSVYQMYLRMRREEKLVPAKYLILNIYSDDHFRSLVPWQRIREASFGLNHTWPPQPYITANPATGEFVEHPNPCSQSKELYNFCNVDWVYERFKDDFALRIMLAKKNAEVGTPEDSYKDIESLAEEYGNKAQIKTPRKLLEVANSIFKAAALYGGMRLVEKAEKFATENGKEVLFVASYSEVAIAEQLSPGHGLKLREFLKPGFMFYEDFNRFMKKKRRRFVDLLEEHTKDFSNKKISLSKYLAEYWVAPALGPTHYNPAGNQFTALKIRDKVVDMIDPKPSAYIPDEPKNWETCVSLD